MDDSELRTLIERLGVETRQHFDVVTESLRSDVKLVSEGVTTNGERLERITGQISEEFEETTAMIRLSYSELDRRLRTLEEVVSDLQNRVGRLEAPPPDASRPT